MPLHKNRIAMSVSGTPGTGTITLGSALTGYRSFSTGYGANATVDALFKDGSNWEIARNCAYTHSGTTLTRGTLEESSSGSAISLTSSAEVYVIWTAERANTFEAFRYAGFSAYGDGSSTASISASSTTLVSDQAKTELYDSGGVFNTSTGIFFPNKAGLYLIGGTAIVGVTVSDGSTIAVYVEYSANGSTWTDSTRRALLWRGMSGASSGSIGGSGAFVTNADGVNDRFRMVLYYGGTGTQAVPATVANRDWIRFWAKYLGETS